MVKSRYEEKFDDLMEKQTSEFSSLLESIRTEYSALVMEYNNKLSQLEGEIESIKLNKEEILESLNSIEDSRLSVEEKKLAINEYHSQMFIDNSNGELCIKNDIDDTHSLAITVYNELVKYKETLLGYTKIKKRTIGEKEYSLLPENKRELTENVYYAIDEIKDEGVRGKITALEKEYKEKIEAETESQEERKKDTDIRTQELFDKINSLLPGATVAGLAEAFHRAKRGQVLSIFIWILIFSLSLAGMSYVIFYLFNSGLLVFSKTTTFEEAMSQAVKLISFEFPFIWGALFASKKIAQHTRVYEEYLHKWSIARTFEGFRTLIEQTQIEEQDKHIDALFSSFLNSISFNPSTTLDKNIGTDSPLECLANSVSKLTKRDKEKPQLKEAED